MFFKYSFVLVVALNLFIVACSTGVNEVQVEETAPVPTQSPAQSALPTPSATPSPSAEPTPTPAPVDNDTIEKAIQLSINNSLIGDIQLEGTGITVNYYSINVIKDVRVNIRTAPYEGSVLDTYVELLTLSNSIKATDDDSGHEKFSFLSYVPDATETLYIKITAYSGYGNYQISASHEKEGTVTFIVSMENSFESKILSLVVHAIGTDHLATPLATATGAVQNGTATFIAHVINTSTPWKGLGSYHVSGYIDMDDSDSLSSSDYIISNYEFTMYDDAVVAISTLQFSLAPLMDDFYESDNTKETAKEITPGTSQARTIHSKTEEDVDWVFFSATEGDIYELKTSKLGEDDVDTVITLYSSTGTFIMNNDDDGTNPPFSLLRFQAQSTAVYYAEISKFGNSADGAYLLSCIKTPLSSGDLYENDNTLELAREGASAIQVGETQLRSFSSDITEDVDWIAFSPEVGKIYRFATSTAFGENTDTVLYLYDGDGNLLAVNDNESESSNFSKIEWTATSTNPVYMKIEHYQQATALYRITVTEL